MAFWWQKNKENASYSHLHMDEPYGYMHVEPQIWGSDRSEEFHIAKEINRSAEIPSPALNEKEAHADSARYLEIITLQMCSEIDASFGAALGTLNKNTFAQIITRTDSWNLLTIPTRRAATEIFEIFVKVVIRVDIKHILFWCPAEDLQVLPFFLDGFSRLHSGWCQRCWFYWYNGQQQSFKQMMLFTKASPWLLWERKAWEIRAACCTVYSVSSRSQPFYSAVEENTETETWLKTLSHHRIRMHPVFIVLPPRLSSNKVINAVLSSSSFTVEKPKRIPQGHLCLCSSCPCLPSFTSGSFHWEKDAGWGAALQIPPGCGICNKQPRGTSAALSLLTPGTSPQVPP